VQLCYAVIKKNEEVVLLCGDGIIGRVCAVVL
jgi:hypothetical protein